MHLVAARALKLPHYFRPRVRVVGVDVLLMYDVVCGAPDNLFVTRVLIGHMAVEARLHVNGPPCNRPPSNGLLMYLLYRL
jgi:hypothetical protein